MTFTNFGTDLSAAPDPSKLVCLASLVINEENRYPADEMCTASFWDLLVMLRVAYTMIAGDDHPLVSIDG